MTYFIIGILIFILAINIIYLLFQPIKNPQQPIQKDELFERDKKNEIIKEGF